MTTAATIQTSFNGGEISPRLFGRTDLRQYGISVAASINLIPTVQGGANKRAATRFVNAAKVPTGRTRLIPFIFNRTQAYICEQGAGYCRFYTNDVLLTVASTPVEVTTPWTLADLDVLSWVQSNDVQYQCVAGKQPQELRRTGASAFAMQALALSGGPLKDQNTDKTITVTASNTTGGVTLYATSPIFQSGHVGGLFELEAVDFSSVPAWEPYSQVAVGNKRRSDGKVYEAANLPASGSQRTGSIQPTHTAGQERDGTSTGQNSNNQTNGGVLWTFLHLRAGLVQITGFTSSTEVTATIINRLPDTVTSGGTWRWSMGAFSNAEGWPQAVSIWNQRLILARNNEIYGSVVGDYRNFSAKTDGGLLTADMAFRFRLNSPSAVVWLAADRDLLVGTQDAEYVVRAAARNGAASSSNLEAPAQSGYGSAAIQAVRAGTMTLFVTPAARRLRASGYDYSNDRYNAKDLNVLAPHVTASGVRAMAYQAEPDALLWAVRNDGRLLSLTFYDEQDVQGWAVHVVGGRSDANNSIAKVESVAVIPAPDGTRDQLWLAVQRWVNGAVVRHIERMLPMADDASLQTDFGYSDCSQSYSGAAATIFAGLSHLIGETVTVVANGGKHPDLVVSAGGTVTLQAPATTAHVGLGYLGIIDTLRLDAAADNAGTIQGRLKRIVKLGLRLLNTQGVSIGAPGGALDDIDLTEGWTPDDTPPPLFTGDRMAGLPAGFDRDGRVRIVSAAGQPFHLLAIIAETEMERR